MFQPCVRRVRVRDVGVLGCPSLSAGGRLISTASRAALAAGLRRNPDLALKELHGVDLTKCDDALPGRVVKLNSPYDNKAVLLHYRYLSQARIYRRVAAVAMLRAAWQRSNGRPVRGAAGKLARVKPATALARKLQQQRQLRRLRRQRSNGRPVCGAALQLAQQARAAALAHMLQLRRLCRVRDGAEVVEPFARSVVAYL